MENLTMFKENVGTLDRALRAIFGIALIAAYFLTTGGGWHWLYLLGIIPLATALFSSCPLYSLLGMSTCPIKA